MTITVETGSGDNASANSYVSVADFKAYADARGYSYPGTDPACEKLLIKAMDYIEAQRNLYQGIKSKNTQPLQWPRYGVSVDGYWILTTTIPPELVRAQCELAVAAYTLALQPNVLPTDTGTAKRKRVEGAVDVEYYEAASKRVLPQFTAAENLLAPLYKRGGFVVARA